MCRKQADVATLQLLRITCYRIPILSFLLSEWKHNNTFLPHRYNRTRACLATNACHITYMDIPSTDTSTNPPYIVPELHPLPNAWPFSLYRTLSFSISFPIFIFFQPENQTCADCPTKGPRWASWNLGCFICIRCSGIHRSIGVHITKVQLECTHHY